MILFEKLEGPYGIPVYFQKLPDIVHSVSFGWTIFVGGADDESIGSPGLYHWFEHVPFRGTKKYPGGYREIKDLCTKNGGNINAYTGPHSTTYHATVPSRIWKKTLPIITNLLSQPLLTDEGIGAERDIIIQEIAERKSSSFGRIHYELGGILWDGHPYGHHVLGSESSLHLMTPSIMRKAHEKNYDRSRCVFVASGNIDQDELMNELEKAAEEMPDMNLPPRRSSFDHGALPKWKKGVTTRTTEFPSSTVLMLFPLPEIAASLEDLLNWSILADMFAFGGLNSPLFRILRDERKLVYHASVWDRYLPRGGYWGFAAETLGKNVDAIIDSFKDVLKDPEIYSSKRIRDVQTGISGLFDIRPIDGSLYRQYGTSRLVETGHLYSDQEYLDALNRFTPELVKNILRSVKVEDSHIIVFRGKEN